MNVKQSNREIREFFNFVCMPLLESKGEDYAGSKDADVFNTFKETAREFNITKYQVWGVHFRKQLGAIYKYICTGKLESESIDSRIADAINYLFILRNMLEEDKK